MTAHTTTYSHNTECNVTRLSSRFWGKCARMLSVVAISAVATGSVYAIGTAGDPMLGMDAYVGTAPSAYALQLPVPTTTAAGGNAYYYSLAAAPVNGTVGTLAVATPLPNGAAQSSGTLPVGALVGRAFTYLPNAGFYGTEILTYNIYEFATNGSGNIIGTSAQGTLTINVTPSLVEAPATGTTTTIAALAGAGVMLVKGTGTSGQPAGTVELTGNAGANTATGGIIVDGGRLSLANNSGFTTPLTIAAKHGAKVDSFASVTFAKVILG